MTFGPTTGPKRYFKNQIHVALVTHSELGRMARVSGSPSLLVRLCLGVRPWLWPLPPLLLLLLLLLQLADEGTGGGGSALFLFSPKNVYICITTFGVFTWLEDALSSSANNHLVH